MRENIFVTNIRRRWNLIVGLLGILFVLMTLGQHGGNNETSPRLSRYGVQFVIAYYNECNPYAAQWLRNLMKEGHIIKGDVDERSVSDVSADDLKNYTQCHFFAGLGGWALSARLAGWPDDRELWTGSCPCQPFSVAGKGLGFEDPRHLWPSWYELIKERKPSALFGEQSAAAIEWIKLVRSDLEAVEYAVGTIPIEAASAGAPHRRDRLWFVADAKWDKQSWQEPRSGKIGRMGRIVEPFPWNESWKSALSRFRIVGDGLPRSVGATDAARNAIVPQVGAQVIAAYMDAVEQRATMCWEGKV